MGVRLRRLVRLVGRWYEYATSRRRRYARVGFELVPRIAGGAGWTFVQGWGASATTFNTISTAATTSVIQYQSPNTAGNTLICCITSWQSSGSGEPSTSVTDDAGNTWSPLQQFVNASFETTEFYMVGSCAAKNNAGKGATVTIHWSPAVFSNSYIVEYSGGGGAPTLNQHTTHDDTSNTTSHVSTAMTPAAGDLLLGLCTDDVSGGTNTSSGMGTSQRAQQSANLDSWLAENLNASNSSGQITFTSTVSSSGATGVISITPGSAGTQPGVFTSVGKPGPR